MSNEPRTEAGRQAVKLRGLFGGETEARATAWVKKIEAEAFAEREALIEVVSKHPRWTEEDQCNLCPSDEPYEQHIAPFLARLLRRRPNRSRSE